MTPKSTLWKEVLLYSSVKTTVRGKLVKRWRAQTLGEKICFRLFCALILRFFGETQLRRRFSHRLYFIRFFYHTRLGCGVFVVVVVVAISFTFLIDIFFLL